MGACVVDKKTVSLRERYTDIRIAEWNKGNDKYKKKRLLRPSRNRTYIYMMYK